MTTRSHLKFLFWVLVLTLIVLCAWKPLRVAPTSFCPFDDKMTSFTGKQRERDGVTECNYKHIAFTYRGVLFTETPHSSWEPCRYE